MSSTTANASSENGVGIGKMQQQRSQPKLLDSFPAKTFHMIETLHLQGPDSVAGWIDEGRAFVVRDTAMLAQEHLASYFKHSNFQSFVRQLNIYGFTKDPVKTATGGSSSREVIFRHPCFLQGREDLLCRIERTNKKVPKKSSTSNKLQTAGRKMHNAQGADMASLQSLQIQISEMSAKIDILLNLATSKRRNGEILAPAYPSKVLVPPPETLGKKRRYDGNYHPPSVSDESMDSDYDLDFNRKREYSFDQMEAVIEEEKSSDAFDPIDYEAAMDSTNAPFNENIYGSDLNEFVDAMLDSEGADIDASGQIEDDGKPPAKSNAEGDDTSQDAELDSVDVDEVRKTSDARRPDFVTRDERAATKTAPNVIEGEEQQYTSANGEMVDAVITQAEPVTSSEDMENGHMGGDGGAPVAIAVAEDHHWIRLPSRKVRIFIGVAIILILIAFIVWPAVVFTSRSRKEQQKKQKPDRDRPPPFRPPPPDGPVAEAIREKVQEHLEENFGDRYGGSKKGQRTNQTGGIFTESAWQDSTGTAAFSSEGNNITTSLILHNITIDDISYQCSPISSTQSR